jgi:cytosine/adenosine deaminase-related metal-dependent hydrolase
MAIEFDPGYAAEPFRTLCINYPGTDVYPQSDFRVEWGPIFHRGRLDGSARILVIGQDPAQNENVLRRILVGVAGQRTQGFLKKLGLTRSYVLINTFLYSVYGQASGQNNPDIISYRNQWINAIFNSSQIEAVVTLGSLADGAWKKWKSANPVNPHHNLPYAHVTHPTQPESASAGDPTQLPVLTKALLKNWNDAIAVLQPGIAHPDIPPSAVPYGTTWQPDDIVPIPSIDLPAGIPDWMGNRDRWAARVGGTAIQKRANITITVPGDLLTPPSPVVHAPTHGLARLTAAPAITTRLRSAGVQAINGTVVTMKNPAAVLQNHTIYIRDGLIVDIRPGDGAAPEGFDGVAALKSGGLIFPGLIDLHNHLAYDVLPLWQVPKKYTNRDQWSGIPAYRSLISGPMKVIADLPGMLAALCRYVECKAMLGGATTSQGVALVNHAESRTFFKGLARNAEETDDPALPAAKARIGDVTAKDLEAFRKALQSAKSCYLLHLSEGTDDAARAHFLALKSGNKWALSQAFAGIHCAALKPADFQILADNGSAMVWSPLSNLLLYGATADIAAAKNAGIRIALGPDWSPSGSKNVLGELKAARAYSDVNGGLFSTEELVAMVTRVAATILRWDSKIGTLEPGKLADLVVVRGKAGAPYDSIINANETDIQLLMIGGVRRHGVAALMQDAGPELEDITVGGLKRKLNLWTEADSEHGPQMEKLTLAEATSRLKAALAGLGQLNHAAPHLRATAMAMNQGWRLALDEIEPTGMEMRDLVGLPRTAAARGVTRPQVAAAPKLSPIALDALTVADDPGFVKAIKKQANLPAAFAKKLIDSY